MKFLISIFFIFSAFSFADDITVVKGGSANIPSDAITVKASHVIIDITVRVDDKNGIVNNWSALDDFKKNLEGQAVLTQSIEVVRVASTYNGREKSNLFGSYNPESSYRLRIFTSMKEGDSVIQGMSRLEGFVESINKPKNIKFQVGSYALAIQDKDSYQAQILSRINARVESVKAGLGGKYTPRLHDFSNEVMVAQNGEDTVALYYSYSIDYEQ
jgi:hypothetical protein